MNIRDHFGLGSIAALDTKEFVCGVEYEIEGISNHGAVQGSLEFVITHDHSLRNNGYEYKTGPATFQRTLELFQFLHKNLSFKKGIDQFTERTSIHVHVNCRHLELSTVKQLLLTYALLEPIFFNYVGDGRKNNIFCVPLNFTALPNSYKKDIIYLHKSWSKYTAFNILPLGDNKETAALGTIEYRHLYGTADFTIFKTWLQSLKIFHDFFSNNPDFDLLNYLEEGNKPVELARNLLPLLTQNLSDKQIIDLIKDTVIDVKLAKGSFIK
jgi:hypothetical protein